MKEQKEEKIPFIHEYLAFLDLLCAGMWSGVPHNQIFPLEDEEWERVYRLSRIQTVEGLVYEGVLRLPYEYQPPRLLMIRWTLQIDQIIARNGKIEKALGELKSILMKENLDFYLLKGQSIGLCYENPLLRVCGDIDLFFPGKKNFKRAGLLMEKTGIKVESTAGFSENYKWRGYIVEHHSRLFDIHNPFLLPYLKKLYRSEEENYLPVLLTDEEEIKSLSPLLTHVLVHAHIIKHSLSYGVGMRQLCDSARLNWYYHEELDGERLKSIYRKLGVLRWIHSINDLTVKFLDMPEDCLPFPLEKKTSCEFLLEDVLGGGNFGFYEGWQRDLDNERRRHPIWNFMDRFLFFAPYSYSEAFWFPLVQTYSKIFKFFKG